MADSATRSICSGSALVDGGAGVRFQVLVNGQPESAFVVRYKGTPRAYLNACAHRGVELDWEQSRFFDVEQRWLICSTHGALFEPATGHCVRGPCEGASLTRLPVAEQNGEVCLMTGNGLDLA